MNKGKAIVTKSPCKEVEFAQGGRANPRRMFAALSLVASDPF
jgi:hypothetical protein